MYKPKVICITPVKNEASIQIASLSVLVCGWTTLSLQTKGPMMGPEK